MKSNKKGQFAETMIVISVIILLIAAVIAVSISRGSIPSETNSVAIETLKIGQTFDSLEITAGKVVEQEVASANILESILASGCVVSEFVSTELIKYSGYVVYSDKCSAVNVLRIYTQQLERQINEKIKSLESARKELSAGGHTFFNSYAYSVREAAFVDDNFVVYTSQKANTNGASTVDQKYDAFVLGKKPLQIKKIKPALWELDASRNLNFKEPLNSDAQETLSALKIVSEFDGVIGKEIAAFNTQKNKEMAENGRTDLTTEILLAKIRVALSESQVALGISAGSGNVDMGQKTYWELVTVSNKLWLVLPNLMMVDGHSLS